MKLNESKIDVESEGFTSTGFSLEVDDPQIIEILTQKIYTDPYVFPRDLMANAIDGGGIHELILPDSLNPQWEVEDKGAGMTHEFMMTLYTKIFHSTKRKDNNNIGGFGHGRLSPLAYTDSYTVRSRFAGADGTIMEGNYVVYRGANKVPQISCVAMARSDVQETGVRVVVPVANKDIGVLTQKTQYFGQYLTPTPPGIKAFKYEFLGTNGGIRTTADIRYNRDVNGDGIRLIIGGVPYPAPQSMSRSTELAVDIFFKIGELDVTLSRDAVNATSEAIELMKKRLDSLIKEYQVHFMAELNKQKTVFEKYTSFNTMYNDCSYAFRSYFLNGQGFVAPTVLPIKDVLTAAKKDFAVHMILSDVDRSQWEGIDNETKSYRSLNALRIFMLNDKCDIERRDGRVSTQDIRCQDLFRRTMMEGKKPVIVPFAVPLPYGQGQIKKIKEAMAKKLAEIRTKHPNGSSSLQAVLIQYEDKADVQAILDQIITDLKPTFIDTGTASGNKLARYIPVLKLDQNGSKKMAMSENVLAATKNLVYSVKSATHSENELADAMYMMQRHFPSFKSTDQVMLIINQNDVKYLPATAKEFKPLVIAAIAKDFGYEYTTGLFDKDKQLRTELTRQQSYTIFAQKVKGTSKTLAAYLLDNAVLATKKPKLIPVLQEIVTLIKGNNGSATSPSDNLREMLSVIINLRDRYKIVTAAELPKPTKKVAAATQTIKASDLTDLMEKYVLLPYIADTYDFKYYGYPIKVADGIAEYLIKI